MIDSILTFCDEVLSNPVWFYIITLLIKIVICFAITILSVSYTHLTLPTKLEV